MLKRIINRRKGQLVPRDVFPRHQRHFFAFRAWRNIGRQKRAAIEHLHLCNTFDIINTDQRVGFDLCAGLFICFAGRALRHCLALFHKTGRQCPKALTRFNSALAHENFFCALVLDGGDNASDNFWVLIIDKPAMIAHITFKTVIMRHFFGKGDVLAIILRLIAKSHWSLFCALLLLLKVGQNLVL